MTLDDLAAILKRSLDEILAAHADGSGQVDYTALRGSPAYWEFRQHKASLLCGFNPHDLRDEASRRAFWINLYNALTLDAVIAFRVQRSVTEGWLGILAFFRRAAYCVGGSRVSLDDIEHGILRANRGFPYFPGEHFPRGDPRRAWVLPLDPRLHFAINCASRSCPPIQTYSADRLDQQLDLASRAFVEAGVQTFPEENQVVLSKIFDWYQADFGGWAGVLDFVLRRLPADGRRVFLQSACKEVRVRYARYDWRLNQS